MIPRHFQITIAFLLLAILISGILIIRWRDTEQASQESSPAIALQLSGQGKLERIRILVAYDDDLALRWRDGGLSVMAVSDLNAQELEEFGAKFTAAEKAT